MTTVFLAWLYGRFIEIEGNVRKNKFHRMNQGSNFLEGSFRNRDNVRAPIQFRKESQLHYLKRLFFLKNRSIQFHINSTSAISLVKEIRLALKPESHFLPQSSVLQIRFKFRSQFQLLPQIRCLITFTVESSIISIDSNVTDKIIKVINLQQEK